jgi:transcriptional regulator with XRE-family HTH domain
MTGESMGSTFGQRLRSSRREAGLSQSELETRSGIPKARLSRYENGHVLPSIGTLGRLAGALGVSEASLLGDQRSLIDEFAHTLMARGVVLHSSDQARKVANAIADIFESFGLGLDGGVEEEDVATATLVDVLDGAAGPLADQAPV